MKSSMFHGSIVTANRIIFTPSAFAKENLLFLQETGQLQARKPHTSKRRNLSSLLFFIVLNGSGTLTYDNSTFSLSAGDCVFLDCHKSYSHHTANALWNIKWVHFFGANAENLYRKYTECGGQSCFCPENFQTFENILDQLFKIAASDDSTSEIKICEKLTSLFVLLLDEHLHPDFPSKHSAARRNLEEIKKFLDEHYAEKLSLELLEKKFFINKFYLSRLFKEQFGISINNYLLQLRITQAKHLLRFSDLNIEEIGQQCGIEDSNYFSRIFKKTEGITPRDYRRLW